MRWNWWELFEGLRKHYLIAVKPWYCSGCSNSTDRDNNDYSWPSSIGTSHVTVLQPHWQTPNGGQGASNPIISSLYPIISISGHRYSFLHLESDYCIPWDIGNPNWSWAYNMYKEILSDTHVYQEGFWKLNLSGGFCIIWDCSVRDDKPHIMQFLFSLKLSNI